MANASADLRNEISKLQHECPDKRWFVSPKELKALLTEERICVVVRESNIPVIQHAEATELIFGEAQILLGILIWAGAPSEVLRFIEHRALDKQLPLEEHRAKEIAPSIGISFFKLQWSFIPPIFQKEMRGYHCRFREEEILPIIQERGLGKGNVGIVDKITVVSTAQTIFPDSTSLVYFVRKALVFPGAKSEKLEKTLQREKQCHLTVTRLHHRNIAKILGSYAQNGVHNLLFPLFRMDLEQFLHLERFGDFKQVTTFYSALEGLSSALEKIHDLSLNITEHKVELKRIGYHHDLKPANILVDHRTFYLADFGTANMKPSDSSSQTTWKSIQGDYVAPECMDEDFNRLPVGRAIDMWSFGCLISEIVTYIYMGPTGVDKFRSARLGPGFFLDTVHSYFFDGKGLKRSVIKWFDSLSDTSVPHDAEISPRHLLELSRGLLETKPTTRPKASETHPKMAFLATKSLFIAVLFEVNQCIREYLLRVTDKAMHAMVRLETARLDIWGNVLCLSTSTYSAKEIRVISSQYDRISSVLMNILNMVRSDDSHKEPEIHPGTTFAVEKPSPEELRELVSQLWNSIPTDYREKMASIWTQRVLQTDNQEVLSTIQASMHLSSDIYSEVNALAMAKRETLRLKLGESHDTEGESFLLDPGDFSPKGRTDDYDISSYQLNTLVLIEWIYPVDNLAQRSESKTKRHLELLAKVLHLRSKPTELCVLDCLGFILSNDVQTAYGFVYAYPQSLNQRRLKPISLSDILDAHDKRKHDKKKAVLGERFQLAFKLVSTLRQLHLIGWLHKNICSTNILFFEDTAAASDSLGSLPHPYLINFRDARPSNEPSKSGQELKRGVSLDHYRHPDYAPGQQHYRTAFDYYSIGIVLLEIGTWHPMEEYAKKNSTAADDPAQFRSLLMKKYVPRLGHLMGTRYRDATIACLEGSFGRGEAGGAEEDLDDVRIKADFCDKVVGPLSQLAGCLV